MPYGCVPHQDNEGASQGYFSMSQVVIENPIINSPFEEPTRHFKFDDEGITKGKPSAIIGYSDEGATLNILQANTIVPKVRRRRPDRGQR